LNIFIYRKIFYLWILIFQLFFGLLKKNKKYSFKK